MTTKPQLHANLTEEGHALLTLIAHEKGITVTALLELYARAEAKRMRIRYDPDHPALAKIKRKADRTKKEDPNMERPTTVYWRCEHTGCAGIIAADWPAPREWTELTACPICGHRSRCAPAATADYVLADQAELKRRHDQQQP